MKQCWSKRNLPHCGDRVFDVADPRHVGRVDAVNWGHSVNITWDNGFRSVDVPILKPNGQPRFNKETNND